MVRHEHDTLAYGGSIPPTSTSFLARADGYGTVPPKDRCGGSIPLTGTLQSHLTGASLVSGEDASLQRRDCGRVRHTLITVPAPPMEALTTGSGMLNLPCIGGNAAVDQA